MPTNLPPEYFAAEHEFREAESTAAKIECLEKLISTVPKHKGTDHLRADLRRKLAHLKNELQQKKHLGRHSGEFHIIREGAARIVVLGPTNTGKSLLVTTLTNAQPKVSPAPFTTWSPTPGMWLLEKVPVQIIDTPPLNAEFTPPELFDLARTADLLLLFLAIDDEPLENLAVTLQLLTEHRVMIRSGDQTVVEPRSGTPALIVVNKIENHQAEEELAAMQTLLTVPLRVVGISLFNRWNLDQFALTCFRHLAMIRVYSKPPGREADLHQPFILKDGATVFDLAFRVHHDVAQNLKTARVWGSTAFGGQMVCRDYRLKDGDIVELHH